MMKSAYLCVLWCAVYASATHAEIYKSVDADGHVTYSSISSKGSKKLDLEPLASTPTPSTSAASAPSAKARNTSTPADFPKVDSTTQKSRDGTRRKILEDELGSEEKLLGQARQDLKEAEGHPEVSKSRDGQTRNTPKYDEKIKALRDEITGHEKNITALKSEITNLK
jgi:Domain of unknown function (DUF4124)